ncbi:MAG: hypothetical protein LBQ54_11855 [Planctomycetaceae bacterium]|jgi:hypothetical protein|nr:hypothetical protein [Planctomycetaceae bacterium]
MSKVYIDFDPKENFPKGDDLFYECRSCGIEIPSAPQENLCCKCFNIFYDVDEDKFTVGDIANIALFRKNTT